MGESKKLNRLTASLSTHPYLAWAVALALVIVAYLPIFEAGFVYDDHFLVKNVEAYENFDLAAFLLASGNGLEYLPVRDLTLAIDAAVWGMDPLGFHLSNLLYFALTLAALHGLLLQIARWYDSISAPSIAFVATILFALHPLNTEAVAFITGRNNILALLFIVLTCHGLIAGVRGHAGWLCAAAGCFVLAMLSKASAVFLPAALALICLGTDMQRPARRRAWVAIAGIAALALPLAIMHMVIAGQTGIAQPNLARFGVADPVAGLLRAMLVPAFYLRYFLFPWPQSVSYDEISLLAWARPGIAMLLAAAYALALFGAWRSRHGQPLLWIGCCWFLAALIPVLNFFPAVPFVADRYLFTGMPGLTLIVATGLASLPARRAAHVALAALAAVLLTLTLQRSAVWRSDISLWEAAWKAFPSTGAHPYFTALVRAGEEDRAVRLAGAERPQTYRLALFRCERALRHDRFAEALPQCRQALQQSEGYSAAVRYQVRTALAAALEQTGDALGALQQLLPVVDADLDISGLPFRNAARQDVMRLRALLEPRREQLAEWAAERPNDVRSQGEYGLFLLRCGDYAMALEVLRRASELDPGNWAIHYNLGLAALKGGDLDTARGAFDWVPRGEPAFAEALNLLAIQHQAKGEREQALSDWTRAVSAQPSNPRYRVNLASHYLRRGDRTAAQEVLVEGLELTEGADRALLQRQLLKQGL